MTSCNFKCGTYLKQKGFIFRLTKNNHIMMIIDYITYRDSPLMKIKGVKYVLNNTVSQNTTYYIHTM